MDTSVKVSTAQRRKLSPAAVASGLVAAGGAATVLGAYYFQYVVGIAPCPLCLMQRQVWYGAIPLALAVLIGELGRAPRRLVTAGLVLLVAAMLVGAGIAIYHAGVEWRWWPGPQECSGPISGFGNAGTLLQRMESFSVVRCDEVSWRFLGLSLAGYNALISLALGGIAAWLLALRVRAGEA